MDGCLCWHFLPVCDYCQCHRRPWLIETKVVPVTVCPSTDLLQDARGPAPRASLYQSISVLTCIGLLNHLSISSRPTDPSSIVVTVKTLQPLPPTKCLCYFLASRSNRLAAGSSFIGDNHCGENRSTISNSNGGSGFCQQIAGFVPLFATLNAERRSHSFTAEHKNGSVQLYKVPLSMVVGFTVVWCVRARIWWKQRTYDC